MKFIDTANEYNKTKLTANNDIPNILLPIYTAETKLKDAGITLSELIVLIMTHESDMNENGSEISDGFEISARNMSLDSTFNDIQRNIDNQLKEFKREN